MNDVSLFPKHVSDIEERKRGKISVTRKKLTKKNRKNAPQEEP